MTLSFNVRALGFATISGLLLVPFAACSSDANSVTHASAGTSGAAPAAAGGGAGGSTSAVAGGGSGGGGSPAAGATGGAGSAGTSGGGTGGLAAGSGGAGSGGVAGGSAGNAGNSGSAGAGTCTPTSGTQAASGTQLATTGWAAHWNVPCDFTTNGGCSSVLPPERAFDGKGDTRTSIGDTHIKAGSKTAQVIGDTFTFDMKTCNRLSKLVMFSAAPPGNQGSFDTRDFPGTVEVRVASNCTTKSDGSIDGTFGDVVATANEAQPNCQGGECTKPMTINIDPPVAAQCVQLKLTHILALGGGIWWAIDELQAFP